MYYPVKKRQLYANCCDFFAKFQENFNLCNFSADFCKKADKN